MSSIGVGATNTDVSSASARTSVVLTKPASLAVGDEMIVGVVTYLGGSGGGTSVTPPAGWTTIEQLGGGGHPDTNLAVFGKIADANDVAATNFTFTFASAFAGGFITRFTGTDGTTPVIAHHSTANATSTTPSDTGVTAGIQPLLIMVVASVSGLAARTTSGYQVANTNPSWTEQCDVSPGGSTEMSIAMASAPYTLATATGTAQATLSGSVLDSVVVLIALQPQRVYATVLSTTSAVIGVTVLKKVVVSVVSAASTIIPPTVSVTLKKWSNLVKSALTSFTNLPKS